MSMLDTLTEGIKQRMLSHEGEAILDKWEKTGLLEGLDDVGRNTMARLLENQAAQLLKEVSTMQAGDVQGFASVAFPIVRRVFGGLLAQDLVSVQPMSLPSGLIFFLDFTYGGVVGANGAGQDSGPRLAEKVGDSLYGGGRVGQQITGGVDLSLSTGSLSFYELNNGYSSPTASVSSVTPVLMGSGTFITTAESDDGGIFAKILRDDPSLVSGTSTYAIGLINAHVLAASGFNLSGGADLVAIVPSGSDGAGQVLGTNGSALVAGVGSGSFFARSLTTFSGSARDQINLVALSPGGVLSVAQLADSMTQSHTVYVPIKDSFVAAGNPFGAIAGSSTVGGWGLENNPSIPEINIKVDSVAVTAITKKLKAKWTPELAQDLNAYHNLDAEVELTSILSEQIALEIDQEILEDLVVNATAGTLWWSRSPGKFLDRESGNLTQNSLYPDFTGTVSEWYETLLETINDLSARIHRKTLRGGANFVVCSPEVASILEFTSGFKANVAVDEEKGSWGAVNIGSLSRKMEIHVDPYFIRNVVLVGRKGSSFLESGYVYAPYVPLQVTPTIFGTEDFVPRKGVMTRYAKQMVRPDMFGLVIVDGLTGTQS